MKKRRAISSSKFSSVKNMKRERHSGYHLHTDSIDVTAAIELFGFCKENGRILNWAVLRPYRGLLSQARCSMKDTEPESTAGQVLEA